jgi:hypothetical protein
LTDIPAHAEHHISGMPCDEHSPGAGRTVDVRHHARASPASKTEASATPVAILRALIAKPL